MTNLLSFEQMLQLFFTAEEKFPGILDQIEKIQADRHQAEIKELEKQRVKQLREARVAGFKSGMLSVFGFKNKQPYISSIKQTEFVREEQYFEKDIKKMKEDLEAALQSRGSSIEELEKHKSIIES